eukprot:CCRYP_012096-RB/>CCRYP_012096-RB protein AED:0.42 eAED:0.41 QI:0/0/0/1/0/0/2/0/60
MTRYHDRTSSLAFSPVCCRKSGFGYGRLYKITTPIRMHRWPPQLGSTIGNKALESFAANN